MSQSLIHPTLTHPEYNTILLSWQNGRPSFFEKLPADGSGILLLDTYYASYGLCMLTSWLLVKYWLKSGSLKLTSHHATDLFLMGTLGAILGAKIFYVLFYNLEYYLQNPADIFLNWSGMASHGGITGGIAALCFYCWKKKLSILHILDHAVLCAATFPLFIRLANFLNAELYGRSASDWLPWRMHFPIRDGLGNALFIDQQSQIYRLITRSEYGQALPQVYGKLVTEPLHRSYESFASVQSLLPHQIWRMRVGSTGGEFIQVATLITDPSHPSQFYQLLVSGVVLSILLFAIKAKQQTTGVVFSSFFVLYGSSRMLMEFFRQPDPQRSEGIFQWMSMGQILSAAMIVLGSVFLYALKTKKIQSRI